MTRRRMSALSETREPPCRCARWLAVGAKYPCRYSAKSIWQVNARGHARAIGDDTVCVAAGIDYTSGMTDDDTTDDKTLFRDMMRGVRRLSVPEPPARPKPRAEPVQSRKDEEEILANLLRLGPDEDDLDFGDHLIYLKEGHRKHILKKLRRGQYSVQAELDLHGLTSKTAKPVLEDFIDECLSERRYCVKIIHGKGWRSGPRGPVLKNKVSRWLTLRKDVLAFCSARRNDGGTGAIYVLFIDS